METTHTEDQIRQVSKPVDVVSLRDQVRQHLDDQFADLEVLTGHAGPSSGSVSAGPKKTKRKRGLQNEIAFWENKLQAADQELEETSASLPALLQTTQERLGSLLASAQDLSLQRYTLADKLSTLISELDSSASAATAAEEPEGPVAVKGRTILEQLEEMQDELARLEAGLVWVSVLEQVLALSEKTIDPREHHPSPLAALPHYTNLHQLVDRVVSTLPPGMSLATVIIDVRTRTWAALKDIMSKNLLNSLEPLRWPLKVDYPSVPVEQRRAFERAYRDLLYLQAEGENLGVDDGKRQQWYEGAGLYPIQAMIQPIALRFKYHFQGSRNTNRVDKPEWAFTSIIDRIYEHQAFLQEYVEPLTRQAGYEDVDVKSEFMMLLCPILLAMLRTRIPHILDSPALLAHTIYQTVVFDDAMRDNGFDVDHVSINEGVENPSWEGLTGVILREEGWFDSWLSGEKRFAESQLQEIISSPDAWNISEETSDTVDGLSEEDLKPTTSARQMRALIEQVTDRYSHLPSASHRLPFLTTIQLPVLAAYLSRINGSLDAFESLSSAFVRAVPGALAGNTRSGVHIDQAKLTGGKAGLERLIKAGLSAGYVLVALRAWSDDMFFVEVSGDLVEQANLRAMAQNELLLPATLRSGSSGSVFDVMIERYAAMVARAEDMIVRHVSVEVENDLKQHLKRRWDRTEGDSVPDASLLHALTTYSSHLSTLALVPEISRSRIYRKIAHHLTNHISQRAVYAGWSKFTVLGGQDFSQEIADWINTSMKLDLPGGETAVKAPWKGLEDAGRVLSLPEEAEGDQVIFGQAMAVAWSDGDEAWRSWTERTGWGGDREALKAVLRRRLDCWR